MFSWCPVIGARHLSMIFVCSARDHMKIRTRNPGSKGSEWWSAWFEWTICASFQEGCRSCWYPPLLARKRHWSKMSMWCPYLCQLRCLCQCHRSPRSHCHHHRILATCSSCYCCLSPGLAHQNNKQSSKATTEVQRWLANSFDYWLDMQQTPTADRPTPRRINFCPSSIWRQISI